jgi:hypothetical protein
VGPSREAKTKEKMKKETMGKQKKEEQRKSTKTKKKATEKKPTRPVPPPPPPSPELGNITLRTELEESVSEGVVARNWLAVEGHYYPRDYFSHYPYGDYA